MKSNRLKLLILLVTVWGLWGLEANASLMPCQIPLNPSEIVPSQETELANGVSVQTLPDGTKITKSYTPDPRFGLISPVLSQLTVKLPSGLQGVIGATRTVVTTQNNLSHPDEVRTTMTVNGKTSSRVYTAANKKVVATSAAGRVVNQWLDENGRVLQTQVPGMEAVFYAYDSTGRLAQVSEGQAAETRTTQLSYNPQGHLSQVTDALAQEVHFTYDAAGRISTQTLPDGRLIAYQYDVNGNLTGITPPSRPVHQFEYNPVDLQTEYHPPLLPTVTQPQTQYVWNLDKQLTQIIRPDGQTVTLNYDATKGRLNSVSLPSGTQTIAYDDKGRISNLTATDGSQLSYSYDGALPTTETWTGTVNGALNLNYNTDFQVTAASVNGNTVNYGYDNDGLLLQAGSLQLSHHAQNGLLLGTQLGNVTTQRSYNNFDELQEETASYQSSPLFHSYYVRDKVGRITQKLETFAGLTISTEYAYDVAGRLIEVKQNGSVVETYQYDANGNRLNNNAVYDAQDRLLQYASNTYTYTQNGELLTKNTTTFNYDVLGNLRQVQLPSKTIDYVIDARNRRVGKKVNGTLTQGFLYQGSLKPVAELNGTGQIVARFVYGSKANIPDYIVKNGSTYRVISDHLGSPRFVVDIQTGAVVQRMEFDAFGNVTLDTNPGFQPFGFAGGLYDSDTKLVRFGARDYDAEIGRWASKDPIRFKGKTTNLYGYVFNNPINFRDANGKFVAGVIPIARAIAVGIGLAGVGAAIANRPKPVSNEESSNNEIPIGELPEPLHSPDTLGDRPDLEGLSDDDLLNSAKKPIDGQKIKVNTKTGSLVDGNSRVRELKKRAGDPKSCITPDTTVPVEPYTPDDSDFWDM